MFSVELSTREYNGYVVVALCGELDIVDAAAVASALGTIVAREPGIIVDLAGLEFIDSSGVAVLAYGRKRARRAGGDLLLAAPRRQVVQVLTLTRLVDVFTVHASVEEAICSAEGSLRAPVPAQRRVSKMQWPRMPAWTAAVRAMGVADPREQAKRSVTTARGHTSGLSPALDGPAPQPAVPGSAGAGSCRGAPRGRTGER